MRKAIRYRQRAAGFTLTEMMVASAVLAIGLVGVLNLFLFSAQSTSGVARLLDLGAKANVLNVICNDVKGSQLASIMTYNGVTFSNIPWGSLQQGNALQVVVPVSSGAQTNYYYVDTKGRMWCWNSSTAAGTARQYLTDIISNTVFFSEDYTGAVISNYVQRTLIEVNVHILDQNPKNFFQDYQIKASAEIRNQ